MTLFEEMLKKYGSPTIQGLLSVMSEHQNEPEVVQQIVKEYEGWMLVNGDKTVKGKEVETAQKNIGYIIGYCNEETRRNLYGALNNISHPIFGASFGRT